MFIQETQRIIDAFLNRFVANVDIEGFDDDFKMITAYETKNEGIRICFQINDYAFCTWIDDNDELHIEVDEESIFDCAQDRGWDEKLVNLIKYGKEIPNEKE